MLAPASPQLWKTGMPASCGAPSASAASGCNLPEQHRRQKLGGSGKKREKEKESLSFEDETQGRPKRCFAQEVGCSGVLDILWRVFDRSVCSLRGVERHKNNTKGSFGLTCFLYRSRSRSRSWFDLFSSLLGKRCPMIAAMHPTIKGKPEAIS